MAKTANNPFKKTPEQKKADAEQGLAEYRARQAAIDKNTERLRALRMAHEAANPPEAKRAEARCQEEGCRPLTAGITIAKTNGGRRNRRPSLFNLTRRSEPEASRSP